MTGKDSGGNTVARAQEVRDECARLIAAKVDPLLKSGSLPPMWPWWTPLVDAIAAKLLPATTTATALQQSPPEKAVDAGVGSG